MTPSRLLAEGCDLVEELLVGDERRRTVETVLGSGGGTRALERLRRRMGAHDFGRTGGKRSLEKVVRALDQRTRQDGFRVLHNWDPRVHRFRDEIVPVLMLDHFEHESEGAPPSRAAVEILLDYYFLHVLTLCAMRAWDHDDPDAMLDRVTELLGLLQGPEGSGHQFVADSETLIIYALSQFHPDEKAYDRVIDRIATLREARRLAFSLPSAAVLGAHLRWGFWLMYGRDVLRMRNDNVGDYPWLLRSVGTLLHAYARMHEAGIDAAGREQVVEGLLLGLAADPWAFTGRPPAALDGRSAEHGEVRALIERYGSALLEDMEVHRPTKEGYAPLALHFNFPHNAIVALLSMALSAGEPQRLSLNALFRRDTHGAAELARGLTAFSGGSPRRLGAHGAMLVAYDPYSGLRSFTLTVDTLRKAMAALG